jgi:hypothetical protein
MVDLLQETVRRRDYKLVFRFGCRELECPSKTCTIFLHRTEQEVKDFIRNIKQRCGADHFTKPIKQCTYCNMIYELEADICVHCEPRAKRRAELELQIEGLEKELKHEKIEEYRENIIQQIGNAQLELSKIGK